MPDPALHLYAFLAALLVGSLPLLIVRRFADRFSARTLRWIVLCLIASAIIAGFSILGVRLRWPPANAMQRFLEWILPLGFVYELFDELPSERGKRERHSLLGQGGAWLWQLLPAVIPRVLLHQSVHLPESGRTWETIATWFSLWAGGLFFFVLGRRSIAALAERGADAVVQATTFLTLLTTGIVIMLNGYVSGGAATLPFSGAALGCCVALSGSRLRSSATQLLNITSLALFSLLWIGRFFGGLSTLTFLALGLTAVVPVALDWLRISPISHLSPDGRRHRLFVGLSLAIVVLNLASIAGVAILDFQRKSAPNAAAGKRTAAQISSSVDYGFLSTPQRRASSR